MTNNDELAMKLKEVGIRRIDACVNACEGVSTENLTNNLPLKQGLLGLNKRIRDAESRCASLLAERDAKDARIAELQTICAESYQVVGALADAAGVFEESDAVSKALDNLSAAKLVHQDVLPFAVEARTVSVPTFEEWCQMEDMKPLGLVREAMKEAYDDCRAVAGIKLEVGE